MKRFLSMLMVLALVLSFAACGNSEPVEDNENGKIPSGNGNLLGGEDEQEPSETPEGEPEEIISDYADLMNTLVWADTVCGVAYVGYVEGPSGDGYRTIIEESGLMEYYSVYILITRISLYRC